MQVVTFRIGDDRFAVDIHAVERVLRYQAPTAVPKLPDWIDGVLSYQGRVIPVLDMRRRFSLAPIEPRPETRVIVLGTGGDWLGVIVDAVLGVEPIAEGQLQAPPPLFRGLSAEYLRGLARHGDHLLMVLDTDRLLTSTERLALEQAREALSDA